jgi:predicted helicase
VEAKKPTEERLDMVEDSEQVRRYRDTFPNLILTNFLEFRFYRNGERVDTILAARPLVLNRLRTTPPMEKPDELYALLERFLDFSLPKAFTAESLAIGLAKRTRFLRDVAVQQLHQEESAPGMLSGFYEAFKTYLIGNLTLEDFADLFAQTITYGLFAARMRAGHSFSRRAAFDNIPHTIGVLRDLFRFISLGDLPEQLAWSVDDIAEVLAVADARGILDRYYREGKGSDPIIHFYETFLAQYDPAERERRGVYYTPEPIVSYIVRSLHQLLKSEFKKSDGLASEGVTILDPAAGTMTFLARAAQTAVHEFETKYGAGARENFIRGHILKNFYAFELMMAPYAVGHLKMGFFLEELGYRLKDNERVPFYLTNTLDTEELELCHMPGFSALAEESRLAGKVKKQTPILVILGNPPYSGHSSNMGDWIRMLIEEYKKDIPELNKPAQAKWLQDDYVKFLRFAQWKIELAGRGIVGMITNHGYIDNPTFRGMRQSLMRTFDAIYVLDLHGNSLKKETCPDGSRDQNVFDIRQGVAVVYLIKLGNGDKEKKSEIVFHADLQGTREAKYEWLNSHDIAITPWEEINPRLPYFLFKPSDSVLQIKYENFSPLFNIFSENNDPAPGIVTTHDQFAISWTEHEAKQKIQLFLQTPSEQAARAIWKLCTQSQWNYSRAKRDLADQEWRNRITRILYRPFDVRWTVYDSNVSVHRRERIMSHMLAGENIALITPKQHKDEIGAFVTDIIGTHKLGFDSHRLTTNPNS